MQLFDISLQLNGYRIHTAEKSLAALLRLPFDERSARQKAMQMDILHFHLHNNNFYRQLMQAKGCPVENLSGLAWAQIPIVEKQDLQKPLPEMISDTFSVTSVFRNKTSGSSGMPFSFAKDKWCHAMSWANNKRLFGLYGIDFNQSLQARFYGMPASGYKYYKEQLKDRLSRRVRFPVHKLDAASSRQYVEAFKQKPFSYINGYTSSLVLFARYLLDMGIVLKEICPSLVACFTTSEICDDIDREILSKAFGVRVVNEYGAAELELLAFEHPGGEWVLNEENLFIEIVDDNGSPLPDGETGRVVVTALHNKAMPFIRYHLGDSGAIQPERRFGFNRILQSLTGRTNDLAVLPGGKKVPGLAFYYVTKSIMDDAGRLKEIVVKQTALDTFEINYVRDTPLTNTELLHVQKLMDEYLEPGLKLITKKVDSIDRTRTGKLRQFENLMVRQSDTSERNA